MKKYIYVLILIPFLSAQCSDDSVEQDCGCKSLRTVASLNDAPAILREVNPTLPGRQFNIYLDSIETNGDYSSFLISCDSLSFTDPIFQDSTRISISGEVKPHCSYPIIKVGNSTIVISNIEVINGN
jgi:hypothetical protein